MKKKVLVISSSFRLNGNSNALADAFIKGAKAQDNDVQKITLHDQQISFCKGCLACQVAHHCILKDDVEPILKVMNQVDVIAFATPIYFYEMCGQLKTLLDRTNPLYDTAYQFRDIYFLASAADEEKDTFDGAIKGLQGWLRCFDKTTLKGMVLGFSLDKVHAIQEYKKYLDEAYALGNNIGNV